MQRYAIQLWLGHSLQNPFKGHTYLPLWEVRKWDTDLGDLSSMHVGIKTC